MSKFFNLKTTLTLFRQTFIQSYQQDGGPQIGNLPLPGDSYFLMRRLLVGFLGFLYFNTFLILFNQGIALLGREGLLPMVEYHQSLLRFERLPSLFLFSDSDSMISLVAVSGMAVSLILVFGYANFPLLLVLWIFQISLVHSGQIFYGYGWETQLLELTFLCFFLCPLWNPKLDRPESPPKKVAIYFLRWMMFRLMLGAGLIKVRGDPCWTELTCTIYHYETQPNPHPLSWFLHQLPDSFHKVEVLMNHFVELIVPFGVFGPPRIRRISGVIMIGFQCFLILSGNLSWLNWVTMKAVTR